MSDTTTPGSFLAIDGTCPSCSHPWERHYQPLTEGPAAGLTCLALASACQCRALPSDASELAPEGATFKESAGSVECSVVVTVVGVSEKEALVEAEGHDGVLPVPAALLGHPKSLGGRYVLTAVEDPRG